MAHVSKLPHSCWRLQYFSYRQEKRQVYNFILQIQFHLTSLLFKKHVLLPVGIVHNNAWGL